LKIEKVNNATINVLQDAYQDVTVSMINKYLVDYYGFSVVDSLSTRDNFWKFINTLVDCTTYRFEISSTSKVYYIEQNSKDFLIISDVGNSDIFNVNIFGRDIAMTEKVYQDFKKFEHVDDEIMVNFNTFSNVNNKITEYNNPLKACTFNDDIPDYYPYLNTDELFRQFTLSNENILVLSGAPGTGKTRATNLYIKWLIKNPDICREYKIYDNAGGDDDEQSFTVGYVKNEEILAHDGFWETITKFNPALVFLDDADFCLSSRKNEVTSSEDFAKNKFLGQLLSFTDGITKNRTKFIITTNVDIDDIDTAILRKGRTFDILKLRNLTNQEALNIWKSKGYSEEAFSNYITSDNIPACDLGSAINKEESTVKSGKVFSKYLLEDGISILNSNKNKTVGFFK